VPVALRSVALLVAAATAAALAAPAQATFPGRNGKVYWTDAYHPGGYVDADLVEFDPRSRIARDVWECVSYAPDPAQACTDVTGAAASPDGSIGIVWIRNTFTAPSPPPRGVLHRVSTDGRTSRDVDLPASWLFLPAGDRRTLRFVNDGATLTAELYTGERGGLPIVHRRVGVDGTPGAQVGPPEAATFDWSVDGRAAYELDGNLYILERDGTTRQLTRRGGIQPSWSPHGRWIVFSRAGYLYVIDSRGGRPRRLTTHRGEWPTWSPDGRKIAYIGRYRIGGDGREVVTTSLLYLLDFRTRRTRALRGAYSVCCGDGRWVISPPEWQALPRR
jgi:hypothetical protein